MGGVRSAVAACVVLVTLVVAAPPSARASFTSAEEAELLKLVNGLDNISEALRYVAYAIRRGTTAQTQGPLADSLALFVLAARDAERAYGLLLDVITEQRGTSIYKTLEGQSRTERMAQAWWRIDRSVNSLVMAEAALTRAFAANTDSVYQDNVRRARDIWSVAARRYLLWVDRSLAYATPNPASFPKVIGPHGDYDQSQWFLWRSHWYALDMLDSVTAAFRADSIQTDYWSVYKTISSTTSIMDAHVQSAGTLAGMTMTSAQVGQDPFFKVLDELEIMTEDTPERYHEIQRELATWIGKGRSATLASLSQALIRLTDSWRHADHGVWQQLTFPNCTLATGCGGR